MQGYQYKHGDRPLEGYTIQRALGRGGFGEVYYALSDSGREVALKCVQGYEEIELRGIRQCMNLKSPYLVTIFDVRYNDDGRPFVLMEYVSGPSLRDLLSASPAGMGAQKAAFFLREIGKGLTYLHDRGIVHRDLKPGNIFFEDGYVKIGDYGLSKAMTASQHSGQTITVGTVHYMAPEIGQGRYDQGIDIYALGVVLYEMLTGQTPFFGASPGEILMKHMASEPELDQVEEPFTSVIRRAMAKDPAERFQTAQEMVEALFGAEHIRQSVSHFRPEELSTVAERVGQKVVAGAAAQRPGSSAEPTVTLGEMPRAGGSSAAWDQQSDWWDEFGRRMGQWGERMGRWGSRFGREMGHRATGWSRWRREGSRSGPEPPVPAGPIDDPLRESQRHMLSVTAGVVVAVGIAAISPIPHGGGFLTAVVAFWTMFGAGMGVLYARSRLGVQGESGLVRRLAYGGLACVCGSLCAVPAYLVCELCIRYSRRPVPDGPMVLSIFVPLFLLNWQKRTSPGRTERVSLGYAISAGLAGLISASIFDGDLVQTIGVLAGISLWVQVASAYDPKNARDWRQHVEEMRRFWHESGQQAHRRLAPEGSAASDDDDGAPVPPPPPVVAKESPDERDRDRTTGRSTMIVDRPVPAYARSLALLAFVLLLSVGVASLVWAGVARHDDEMAIAICAGVGAMLLGLFSLVKAFQPTFRSWWSSLTKPLLMLVCLECAFCSAMVLGFARLHDEEIAIAVFMIVLPSLLFLVIAALPNAAMHSLFGGPISAVPVSGASRRSRLTALLLASVPLGLAVFGIHRLYVGKIGTGLLWLVTFGLCGVGQVYDIVMIAIGHFRDRDGRPLTVWDHDDLQTSSTGPAAVPAAAPGDVAGQPPPVGHAGPAGVGHFTPPPAGGPPVTTPPSRRLEIRLPFQPGSLLLSLLGGVLLLAAFVVGLALAAGLPEAVAAGLPEPGLARELEREFGYPGWPRLVNQIGIAAAGIVAFLAMVCLVVARRRGGFAHVARALLGSSGLLLGLYPMLHASLRHMRWDRVAALVQADNVGMAIEMVLDTVVVEVAVVAGLMFLVSIVLLVWPARRPAEPTAVQAGAHDSRSGAKE